MIRTEAQREKNKVRCKAWAAANKQWKKDYNRTNAQKLKMSHYEYLTTINGWATQMASHIKRQGKRRSGRRGKEVTITKSDIIELWDKQKGLCAITNLPLKLGINQGPEQASIDRINNEVGYIRDNIRLVWLFVQYGRNKWSDDIFIECCKKVAKTTSD